MPIVIGAVVGVLVGGVLGALIGWRIYGRTVSNVPLEVARAFEVARARYADRLGDPLSDVYPIEWVYHAQHEHATVILPYKGLVYALKNDDGDGNRVLKELDDYGVTDSNNYWLKDDEIIKLFVGKFGAERGTPPEGLSPPYGSVALGWFTEPDKWEGIGWRMNHCWHEKENVYVQRFQNGLIIGSLRQKPIIDDAQAGRIYVLLTKEHKWEYVEGEQGVFPPCQKPRTS
jgi:hypothetical protein